MPLVGRANANGPSTAGDGDGRGQSAIQDGRPPDDHLSKDMVDFGHYREVEFSSPDKIEEVQTEQLRTHLHHCREHSSYYSDILPGGIDLASFTLDDLVQLPFTDKSQLEKRNDEFLAVPPRQIVDIVLSSGTTGYPTRIMYTESDLVRLAYNEQQSLASCEVTADDVVLLTCTMDRCFVAGLAYFLGARAIGAATIRNGHGTMASHQHVIGRMHPTVIVGVPSFLRKLAQHMRGNGADPATSPVTKLICIGEPVRDESLTLHRVGSDLETLWGARTYSTYASSETITTFCECTARQGGHLHPDLAIVEIVDQAGNRVSDGESGEVVVTPLAIQGMPLVRFKTGDISFLMNKGCPCGRQSPRLGPIIGRKKQMMKVRGTTLYPQAIYTALDEVPGIIEYCITVAGADRLSDEITIHVAVDDESRTPKAIGDTLQARLRVTPTVIIEPEGTVRGRVYNPESRKPVRFIDQRK